MSDILVSGNNLFALTLHNILAKDENVFFSPISLSTVLSMLLYGTRGNAASELRKALGQEGVDNDALSETFQDLLSSLEASADGYTVSYGNSVVMHKDFVFHEEYISTLKTHFKALCTQADFTGDASGAVNNINDWVRMNTNGKISKLLEELDPQTVMVLLNAVYFKGSWLKRFEEKATFKQYFYNDGVEDDATLVEMMHLKNSFKTLEAETFKALELPYRGEEIAMMILLPNTRDGLSSLEKSLAPGFIEDIRSKMSTPKIEVALPKFKLELSANLKSSLQEMGVGEVFDVGADFGGISDCKNLVLSEVVHKAVLEVNEEGCEAAAATAGVVMCRALRPCPEFVVDHPFLFVICSIKNNLILFMGRVTKL